MKKRIYTRPVTVTLPDDMFEQIKTLTDQRDIGLSDYIREAIQEKLQEKTILIHEDKKVNKQRVGVPGVLFMDEVSSDLNPKGRLRADATCDCCGRHISKLKPFGKAGDPLNGDLDGAILVKTFRGDDIITEKSWECRDCIVLDNEAYELCRKNNIRHSGL